MISAVAILMLCNGIRISLKSKKYNQRNRVCHGVHDTPFSFLHFFHRISRMNRRHSCLSDYSRIFADIWPLANGWRPKYSLIVFVTQISQMTQIFLRGSFLSHRFRRYTQIFYGISGESLCQSQGVSATTGQVASVKIRE